MSDRPPDDLPTLLVEVRQCLDAILDGLPDRPARLRVRAGAVTVEVGWPADGTRAIVPAPTHVDPTGPRPDAEPDGDTGPEHHHVRAPSVGTFYRCPEPGAAPFAAEGDHVASGDQIGIIEAMKLLLPVEVDRAGRVVAFLRGDGEPVEYGTPLVALDPSHSAEPGG